MEINVVIEIPQGSDIKYEIDHKTGKIYVDRFLYAAAHYPFNYGYVEGTLAPDGDPLDCLVISREAVIPGTIMRARPVGALHTIDENGDDVKVISVPIPSVDPFYSDVNNVGDLSRSVRNEIEHFFNHYKELEPEKFVKVLGWMGKEEAENTIVRCSTSEQSRGRLLVSAPHKAKRSDR
ncbi:MAG: inorganic diphosphatase [TACK group archaeon]|nr:inorganic diphosphatase [TACK group archaeon]